MMIGLLSNVAIHQSKNGGSRCSLLVFKNKTARPESFRAEWDDYHLVAEANEDFKKFL
jgi:hypothetical protein